MSIKGNADSNVLQGNVSNPKAIHGKSAYEIAVMHGFDGTEEEWIESLKPPKPTEADEGKFLQAKDGEWKASDFFKVIDNVLYFGDISISEKKLNALLSLVNLKTIRGLYVISGSFDGGVSNVRFTSNGETFNGMQIKSEWDDAVGDIIKLYYDDTRVAEFNEGALMWSFIDDGYSTVDFGEEGQELLPSEYEWLTKVVSKPKITFTLDGFTVEAESGTLWGNLIYDDGTSCVSASDGYAVLDAYGSSGFYYYIVDENGNKVLSTDEIRAGGVYSKGAMII